MTQPTLFDVTGEAPASAAPADQSARDFAVDPSHDVVLEASAGTGKTRVLVDRYVRLIEAGVDPRHILALTFTRKAAAEMRERTLAELVRRADTGVLAPARWRELSDRIADIQILTIDAFCFSLLREFPLEAGVDPAFDIADETEMARFANEALDLTMDAIRGILIGDEAVRLLLARVRPPVLRTALAGLLDRRHIACPAVAAFVRRHEPARSATEIAAGFRDRLRREVVASRHGEAILRDGPHGSPEFRCLAKDLEGLAAGAADPVAVVQLRRRLEQHFLTKSGEPRQRLARGLTPAFTTPAAKARHEEAVRALSPVVLAELERLDREIDGLLARGLLRVLTIAASRYEELLEEYAVLDFAAMLDRTVALLEQQEEFARSRLKLQSRYRHVLVDEFQDTSRRQWRLIELLIDAWGEGEGAADAPTSIFVVGDRKQSIYRFRHAEVTLLDEAARKIGALRPERVVRQAIRTSFRAVPELLAFVNAMSRGMQSGTGLPDRFSYAGTDEFPVPTVAPGARRDGHPVLGVIAEASVADCARAVADEIAALIGHAVVRDRTGGTRPARPDDVAILFRARAGHQFFEEALEERGVRTYVYKGLGFFDAPEVQDLQALIGYLAQPDSNLRAAEFLRSRFVRLSDAGLIQLAPAFASALRRRGALPATLSQADAALLDAARDGVDRWLTLADRVPPGELVDIVLRESAYAFELRGRRLAQAAENIKKVRALVSRVESRGYATLGRLAGYFETLRAGDESNAVIDATGAVSLMTIHAAKGLEFPIVFVVNLHAAGRGRPLGFSVIEQGPTGEPEVAFGSNEATVLEQRREAEELRRLFYVAMTRARDRLYLAAEVDAQGQIARGARSLAALLPDDMAGVFGMARRAPAGEAVEWVTNDGTFAFKVCRPAAEAAAASEVLRAGDPEQPAPGVAPLLAAERSVVAAATLPAPAGAPEPARRPRRARRPASEPVPVDERLVGTVVHRLFHRRADPGLSDTALLDLAGQLLPRDQGLAAGDRDVVGRQAVRLFRTLAGRDEVIRLFGAGECHYEVPFFYDPADRPGERVRGLVDCLVIEPGGTATVVEFKTGRPRPEHYAQAAWYARAVGAALGIGPVQALILYP
jgi:ATP-dependent helicase/nuclease subunit A